VLGWSTKPWRRKFAATALQLTRSDISGNFLIGQAQ
jgi:hypothetical protein